MVLKLRTHLSSREKGEIVSRLAVQSSGLYNAFKCGKIEGVLWEKWKRGMTD